MPRTIILDELRSGRIIIAKEPGEPATVTLEYVLGSVDGSVSIQTTRTPPLAVASGVGANATYQQIANLLWNAAVAYAKQAEGIP